MTKIEILKGDITKLEVFKISSEVYNEILTKVDIA